MLLNKNTEKVTQLPPRQLETYLNPCKKYVCSRNHVTIELKKTFQRAVCVKIQRDCWHNAICAIHSTLAESLVRKPSQTIHLQQVQWRNKGSTSGPHRADPATSGHSNDPTQARVIGALKISHCVFTCPWTTKSSIIRLLLVYTVSEVLFATAL